MKRRLLRVITPLIMLACAATLASAQSGGGTTTLSGLVVDGQGAVVPGADSRREKQWHGADASGRH